MTQKSRRVWERLGASFLEKYQKMAFSGNLARKNKFSKFPNFGNWASGISGKNPEDLFYAELLTSRQLASQYVESIWFLKGFLIKTQIFTSKKNFESISYQFQMSHDHIFVTLDRKYWFSRSSLSFIKNGQDHQLYGISYTDHQVTICKTHEKSVQFQESILHCSIAIDFFAILDGCNFHLLK